MVIEGPKNDRVRRGDVRLEVRPVDREAFLEKLQLGHVVKGRILRQFDGTTYLLRLLGHNLVAESEENLPQGATLRFRVRALEPRVDLQLLEDLPEEEEAAKEVVLDRLLRSVGKRPDDVGRYVLNRMMVHRVPVTARNITELKAVFLNAAPENRELELEARLLLRANTLPETEGNLSWARTATARPQVIEPIEQLLQRLDPENPTHQKLREALQDFLVKMRTFPSNRDGANSPVSDLSDSPRRELEGHVRLSSSRMEVLIAKAFSSGQSEAPAQKKNVATRPDEVAPELKEDLGAIAEAVRRAVLKAPAEAGLLDRYARELARLLEQGQTTSSRREEVLSLLFRMVQNLPEIESMPDLREKVQTLIEKISLLKGTQKPIESEKALEPSGRELLEAIRTHLASRDEGGTGEQIPPRMILRPLLMEVSKEQSPAGPTAQRLLQELDSRAILRNMPLTKEQAEIRPWLTLQIPIKTGGETLQAEIAIRRSEEREADGRRTAIDPRQTTLAFILNTSRMGVVRAVADLDGGEIFLQMGVHDKTAASHLKQGESDLKETIQKNTALKLSLFDVTVTPKNDRFQNKASLDISLLEEAEFPRDGGLGLDVVV